MPRKKPDADFNTTIHDIYERIGAGESSHDDAAEKILSVESLDIDYVSVVGDVGSLPRC